MRTTKSCSPVAIPRPFRCPTVKLTMPACVPKNRAIGMHDLARLPALRPQLADDARVIAVGNEADVLTIGLIRHGQAEARRKHPGFALVEAAQREAQEIELLLRGRKQEIALIAGGACRLDHLPALRPWPASHIVPRDQRRGAKLAGGLQKIGKFYGLIAAHAGDRRFAREIARCEIGDDRFLEAILVVQHVVRDAGASATRLASMMSRPAQQAPLRAVAAPWS